MRNLSAAPGPAQGIPLPHTASLAAFPSPGSKSHWPPTHPTSMYKHTPQMTSLSSQCIVVVSYWFPRFFCASSYCLAFNDTMCMFVNWRPICVLPCIVIQPWIHGRCITIINALFLVSLTIGSTKCESQEIISLTCCKCWQNVKVQ